MNNKLFLGQCYIIEADNSSKIIIRLIKATNDWEANCKFKNHIID
jgi:hypothetical protein